MYEILEQPTLRTPALVVALDGWVNAGSAATIAGDRLSENAIPVVRFTSDELIDYRMTRPVIDFVDGVIDRVDWPKIEIRAVPAGKRDLLVMVGTEPNWNWQRFATATADLAVRFGVIEHVSIGGVPWAAPHTRPVSVMTTATASGHLPAGADLPSGLLRVPGAAVSVVEHTVGAAGIPTVGFWARVPNYVGSAYPAAAVALLDRVSRHLGIELEPGKLTEEAAEQRIQIDAVAASRPEVKAMVEQFEQVYDEQLAVSGEQLASEIERFLRDQSG